MISVISATLKNILTGSNTYTDVALRRFEIDLHKGGSRISKWGANFCNNVREIKYYFNI